MPNIQEKIKASICLPAMEKLTNTSSFTHLFPMYPFSSVSFSDVFRVLRKGALARNGLKSN